MIEATVATESVSPAVFAPPPEGLGARPEGACFHCGTRCAAAAIRLDGRDFCCRGCQTVYELLSENGLADFYRLSENAGVRVAAAPAGRFGFLDEPAVRERLVDFSSPKLTRVTLLLPAIHCIACVWLLENLFRLKAGLGPSQVNFPKKEVAISFDPARIQLSEVVSLLASLGYEPELKLASLDSKPRSRSARRLWIQLGLAGFAFGNIMMFSLSTYFGLDTYAGPAFRRLTGLISLLLALPVVTYGAQDYWRSAWTSLRQRLLNIDVPIAVGIAAIFAQSTYEVLAGLGDGYFDSLCGLIFFLLCGRMFQQKTYDRLAFDRDYTSFFPLSVTRKGAKAEEQVSLAQLGVGDVLILRNGELIPADARLIRGPALIDYSFVTGESEPVEKKAEDHLYAGGRQIGGAIEIETIKPVSQSYLTSLWNQEAFRKEKQSDLSRATNGYSRRFTKIVVAIAFGAALYWGWANPSLSIKAFTAVLIVACPCALALAAPFALGTAQRILSRRGVYLKNPFVLETIAEVDAVVFDKTGTLTAAGAGTIRWHGAALSDQEERWMYSMTRHSTHPLAVRVGQAIQREHVPDEVRSFRETTGCGMEGSVASNEVWMGSAAWLESRGAKPASSLGGSAVHVAIGGRYRGVFVLANALRADAGQVIGRLARDCELALLSGDNEKEREDFRALFGPQAHLRFNQSPLNKLGFIRELQSTGRKVMMVGDGLNDAGALQQADVGVAVVETIGAFSPASDVILSSAMVSRLDEVRSFARRSVGVVRSAFLVSTAYNVVGVGIAASGRLAPVVCAILMPLSSISVVVFACLAATWVGRRLNRKSLELSA